MYHSVTLLTFSVLIHVALCIGYRAVSERLDKALRAHPSLLTLLPAMLLCLTVLVAFFLFIPFPFTLHVNTWALPLCIIIALFSVMLNIQNLDEPFFHAWHMQAVNEASFLILPKLSVSSSYILSVILACGL